MPHKMQPTSLGMLRWGVVVENLIGITLETYVVHDHHDYHTLKGLWQHLKLRGRQPLIVISNFDVPLHTIPARMRAPPGVPCLLDVLGCTDSSLAHVVMNQVIDRVGCLTPHVCVIPNKCYTPVCLLVSAVRGLQLVLSSEEQVPHFPQTYSRFLVYLEHHGCAWTAHSKGPGVPMHAGAS